jgi:hypothetical protein
MKRIYTFCCLMALAFLAVGQSDDPSNPTPLTQAFYSMGTTVAGNLGGSTPSGMSTGACISALNYDVFYSFVAQSQGVKIECPAAAFDMALELQTAANGFMECMNIQAGGVGETMWVNYLVPGDTYVIRVGAVDGASTGAFSIKAEWLPNIYLRAGYYPVDATADAVENPSIYGYKINQSLGRRLTNTTQFPVSVTAQATRWKFIDTGTLVEYEHTIAGTSSLLNLNAVPGPLCFGTSYDVQVQIQLEGQWCGWADVYTIDMEASPTTQVSAGYINGFYNLEDEIRVNFVGNQQQIYWQFTTDAGQTTISDFSYPGDPTSWVYFDEIPCFRYNRIYTVQVAVEYCGSIGPYSTPVNVFTNPLPYTKVRSQYCTTEQWAGNTIQCDFIFGADQYAWQLAPIEEDDPDMQPTGPAIVTYTNNTTSLWLLPLLADGLQYGQAYRVGVKPFLGAFDSCDDFQEGDYGYFCQIVIIDPNDPGIPPPVDEDDKFQDLEEKSLTDSAKPINVFQNAGGQKVMGIRNANETLSGKGLLQVFDVNGRLIESQMFAALEHATVIQYNLSQNYETGIYLVTMTSETGVLSETVFIQQ